MPVPSDAPARLRELAQRAFTPDEIAKHFTGARRDLIERHLDTLALMGEVVVGGDGRYGAARTVA